MKTRILLISVLLAANILYAQHNHPGNPDSSFGMNGEAHTVVTGNNGSGFNDIKIQGDGKIVTAGYYHTFNQNYVGGALVRYNPDGSTDNSFGTNGIDTLVHAADTSVSVSRLAFQSDGKLVVLAQVMDTTTLAIYSIPFIIRLMPNGTVDSSFGTNGKTYFSQPANYARYNISIEGDDKIIITGFVDTHGDYYIARLVPNGTFDSTFGSNGKVSGQSFNYPIWYCGTVLGNGKILVGGQLLFRPPLLARYNSGGTPDSTFGTNGIDTVTFAGSYSASINNIAVQQDGKIVAAGTVIYLTSNAYVSHNFIARYNVNGGLDSSFAVNGIYTDTASPAAGLGFTGVAVQNDGNIIAGGGGRVNTSQGYFGIVRHLSNGNFDSSFGTNGIALSDSSSDKRATAVQVINSRIYIAGSDDTPAGWAVAAYVNDASLLPVRLLAFSGKIDGDAARLTWSAANEINTKGFYVEKSADGMHFSSIGFVKAQSGSSVSNYTYTDNSIGNGNTYYRLQQVDNDGGYVYSNILKLNHSSFTWSVRSNPLTGSNGFVQVNLDHTATISVQVISLNGTVMQTIQKGKLSAGNHSIPFSMNAAGAGLYIVSLTVDGKNYTTKVLKP